MREQYLRKGSKVYLEGKLQTRKWQDQSGADKYSTEIVLQGFDASLVMLDGPQGGEQGGSDGGGYDQSPPGYNHSPAGAKSPDWPDTDDEIPF